MFLLIFFVFTIILCSLHFYIHYSKIGRSINKIPGPKTKFFFGNALDLVSSPSGLFYTGRHWANNYKEIYRVWSCHLYSVNFLDPEDCEILLSSPKHIKKSDIYGFLHPWLKEGLLTSAGEKWHTRRKLLTPTFHFNILKQFCDVFNEESQKLIEKIKSEIGKECTEILPYVSNFTLNTICETAMGTKLDTVPNVQKRNYIDSIKIMSELVVYRLMRVWYYNNFNYYHSETGRKETKLLSTLHKFTNDVIQQRRINRPFTSEEVSEENPDLFTNTKKRLAMLDLLLSAEDKGQIDQDGIREEVDTFTFEGHDTTTMAITFCLMELANNPEIQDRVVEELNKLYNDISDPMTMEKLNNMSYLERCIKETLRLYPSVTFFGRIITEDMQLKKYLLPAGTTCYVHTFDLHRRADLYPDPLRFDPDRFLPENCAKRHPYAYIPFSAGPRNCIGQKFALLEIKAIISSLLRHYRLEPVTRPQDLIFRADIILKTSVPVKVKFALRT